MSYFARHDLDDLNRREVYNLCNAADSRRLFKASGILSKQEADGINFILRKQVDDIYFGHFEALVTSHENLLTKQNQLESAMKELNTSRALWGLRMFLIFAGNRKP